ncbi:ribonuclease P protein component [Enterobacteriaceae endosymbiont of Plateumaris consimilis]|uniref:ribonuclease P protein component n=1 Tax=Enterobacteriaceae endosymbiont of Plateumaris consimilis TaxID=2675794 RepID=UPI0014493E5C|nr:ribonuclease P protein component [Enterobacteriaceae endosymbiont of Plateumaris consimilis]QJC28831.1 ribonuclease P protein component [Enterobacteriaceae endosymbiont of Plateumaris consimilis]
MDNLNFSKKKRLLSCHFNFIFDKPYKKSNKYYTILSKKNILQYSRLGIIIPKKIINKSHIRNKIKRIIREYFRLNQYKLPIRDFIVILTNKKLMNINYINFKKYLKKIWNI